MNFSQLVEIVCVILVLRIKTNDACKTINDCQITPGQANRCLSSGQCLCNIGWTGDHGIYVNKNIPIYGTMLVADHCKIGCNTINQPSTCAKQWSYCDGPSPRQQLEDEGLIAKEEHLCDKNCVINKGGRCSKTIKGACECAYGWTGNDACYYQKLVPNRILAKNCVKACFYNHHVKNPSCVED